MSSMNRWVALFVLVILSIPCQDLGTSYLLVFSDGIPTGLDVRLAHKKY